VITPLFSEAGFVSIRPVSHPMCANGIEQVVVQLQVVCSVTRWAQFKQWLKGFQGSDGALEADRPWRNIVFRRSLGHQRANVQD
jgi:hypothetical protein